MSTFNAPPDQIDGLTLNNGDTLNVGAGGNVSNITVFPGGNLFVNDGGTVVNSVLAGGTESVVLGITNDIAFQYDGSNPESGGVDHLILANPSSLHGELTFKGPLVQSYQVIIELRGVHITNVLVGTALTINYEDLEGIGRSIKYPYTAVGEDGNPLSLVTSFDGLNLFITVSPEYGKGISLALTKPQRRLFTRQSSESRRARPNSAV